MNGVSLSNDCGNFVENLFLQVEISIVHALKMTCPFARVSSSVRRQSSVVVEQTSNWGIEDDLAEIPDALTLTHLQAAIQLLTSPVVKVNCFNFKKPTLDLIFY